MFVGFSQSTTVLKYTWFISYCYQTEKQLKSVNRLKLLTGHAHKHTYGNNDSSNLTFYENKRNIT
jgi:hypothetical protein